MIKVEERFAEVDSIKIRYLTAGSGPAILLLHGVGDSALDWQWIMPRLADRFRLIAPDLPGYSIGAGNGIVHTPANYSRLLWMFVRELGLSPVTVVGNSLGGMVAIRMVLENPGQVPALVLVDSAGLGKIINPMMIIALTPAGDLAMAATATWTGGWLHSGFRSLILFANPWRAPQEWLQEQYRLSGISSFRTAVLDVLRHTTDFTGQSETVTDDLPKVDIPTLVLWGRHDRVVPTSHGQKAVEMLKAGRLEIFPDCGHVPHIENPARFSEVLGNFLEEQLYLQPETAH